MDLGTLIRCDEDAKRIASLLRSKAGRFHLGPHAIRQARKELAAHRDSKRRKKGTAQ